MVQCTSVQNAACTAGPKAAEVKVKVIKHTVTHGAKIYQVSRQQSYGVDSETTPTFSF